MLINTKINAESLMQALASLKDIPISKVVRNASRDFAQAALKATPIAKVSKSEYYKYVGKDGQLHFLHESQVGKRKRGSALRKVRVYRGWSRASWLGVFRSLGVSLKMSTSRLPNKVEHISYAVQRKGENSASTEITDFIHFDQFGRSNDTRTESIARAGFQLAAKRITSETNKMLLAQWGKK